jgi:hypothetical protein
MIDITVERINGTAARARSANQPKEGSDQLPAARHSQ